MDQRTQYRVKATAALIENKTLEQLYEMRKYTLRDMAMASEHKYGVWLHGKTLNEIIEAHEKFEAIILGGEDV